jgi:hypothetical protein
MSMNIKRNPVMVVLVALCSTFVLVNKAPAADPPTNADELVAQHLNSIASPTIRAGIKTRVVQGPVHFSILVGGTGVLDGKAFLVSEGNKLQFMMKLVNNEYRGEQFIFDGKKDSVAFSGARQTRSAFGNFVYVQDAVIREGLLGGVLSTAWPLLNLQERKAKLSFDGLKDIDGQQLYKLRYTPHGKTDLEINLFFDPHTYRHVETTYSYSVTAGLTIGGETATAGLVPNRYRLLEKFSDFKTVDGLALPTHEDIQFSQEIQNGRTTLWDWDLKGLDVSSNIPADPRNFDVK